MKSTRLLALFLACILSLSFFACEKDKKPIALEDPSEEPTTETPTSEEPRKIEMKTYQITETLDKIKTYGRTTVLSNGLACDHALSGIEFNAYIEGTLTVGVTSTKSFDATSKLPDVYFTLYVDGKRSEERVFVDESTTSLTLATFATGGMHNIRLIKQTEPRNALSVLSTLAFKGYFGAKPADASRYIEFIGDSLVAGYGNLAARGTAAGVAQTAENQDATKTFSALTAQMFGADFSMVCASGIGVVRGFRSFTMREMFSAQSYYRNQTLSYAPDRTPDLVVICLSGNDNVKGVAGSDFEEGVKSLVAQVRDKYNADVPIVWINVAYTTQIDEAFSWLGGEAAGLYMCHLPFNGNGGNGHPDLASHAASAETLAQFIRNKNILK